jgi:hypothetical protein
MNNKIWEKKSETFIFFVRKMKQIIPFSENDGKIKTYTDPNIVKAYKIVFPTTSVQ